MRFEFSVYLSLSLAMCSFLEAVDSFVSHGTGHMVHGAKQQHHAIVT